MNQAAAEIRRQGVFELYLKGLGPIAIAKRIHASPRIIRQDVEELQQSFKQEKDIRTLYLLAEHVAIQRLLIEKAWEIHDRPPRVTRTGEKVDDSRIKVRALQIIMRVSRSLENFLPPRVTDGSVDELEKHGKRKQ
jgi:hypothetical protein